MKYKKYIKDSINISEMSLGDSSGTKLWLEKHGRN
jgi:hypothetical protein